MDAAFLQSLNKFLCAGYFIAMASISCIMFLFSSFYRKKFNQPSPRAGFIVAAATALFYVFFLFFIVTPHTAQWEYIRIFKSLCLIGSAIAFGWSSIRLFYTMKRTRK
jgi:Ca2+/H+ antiporter